jgi:hypothetical protein
VSFTPARVRIRFHRGAVSADEESSPLKVTISIRDQWGREDEPVQKALASLKEVIGFDVVIHPQWLLLFTELEKLHPDKVTFVPSIAAAVQEFATVLASLLDDNANADWADTVLEKANGRLRIFIEVRGSPKGMHNLQS